MKLSAVIPCWNEATTIEAAIASAHQIADEVIVADAASPDGTAQIATRAGARVVIASRGRGAQLAAGAASASGDVLLFVHADARLPSDARRAIELALADPDVGGGNFRLRFEPTTTWGRVFARVDHERRRWLGIYYGDSGLFVRRGIYDAIGGFRALPILEDHDLARRLERATRTVYVDHIPIAASARRFADHPLRTLGVWMLIQTLASTGIAPQRLARLYADIR
jgi:rSAM/selenodomain-associated transferase 2